MNGRMTLWAALVAIALAGGCRQVPVLDAAGKPVLDAAGNPATRDELDQDAAADAAEGIGGVVSAALPPPWNLLAAAAAGFGAALLRKPRTKGTTP